MAIKTLIKEATQKLIGMSYSISSVYVSNLVPLAKSLYPDAEHLLESSDIDVEKLGNPDYRLPLSQALKLFEQLSEVTGDRALGIKLGAQVRPKFFQVLGYAAMSSANMSAAIEQLLRYEKLTWDIGMSEFKLGEDKSTLILKTYLPDLVPDQMIEMAMAGWISFGKALIDSDEDAYQLAISSIEIHFKHSAPDNIDEFERLLECKVLFDQHQNQLILPNEFLSYPIRDADPQLQMMMKQQGQQLLERYHSDVNLVNELRAAIYQHLPHGEPELSVIAQQLDLTERSLRRRLQEQGTSFKEVLDGVRKELAQLLLEDESFSLIDIAFLLGFSEQSAFSRAFKRWLGVTPSQYRLNDTDR